MNHRSFYLQSKYGLMTRFLSTKIAHAKENLLTVKKNCSQNQICSEQEFAQKICSQQNFAPRICSQHRKIAHDEKPCGLGWIYTTAKFLASSQSEHGWRALLYGLSLNGWNVLGPDLPVLLPSRQVQVD